MPIRITVTGADKTQAWLSKDRTPKVSRVLKQITDVFVVSIMTRAPVKTGALRASIRSRQTGPLSFEITEGMWYGKLQREGTKKKGYEIHPKNKKALYWPGLDHPVAYVKSHPGIKAGHYDKLGVDAAKPIVQPLFDSIAAAYTETND